MLPVLFVSTFAALSLLALLGYDDLTKTDPKYSAFPLSVEQQLRLALLHVHVRPDPDVAVDAYARALEEAERCGMDLFSKEVLGIRIQLAEMLEKFGRVKSAIEILNSISKDCTERIRDLDRGKILKQRLHSTTPTLVDLSDYDEVRKALLRQVIQCNVKSASLYTTDYIQEPAIAKEILSDTMALLTRETADSAKTGLTENNAAGLTFGEIASILSQTADLHQMTGEASIAVPIYMMALGPLRQSHGGPSCKEVQVLSNIATGMGMSLGEKDVQVNGKPATKESLQTARRAAIAWATKADEVCESINAVEKEGDSICEMGQAIARFSIAQMTLEMGDVVGAEKMFEKMLPELRERRLDQLVRAAEEGLQQARCGVRSGS